MPTNKYINHVSVGSEQRLLKDIITEAIKIYGIDIYYLPRTIVKENLLYNEDTMSEYNEAFMLEVYLKNFMSYGGNPPILSKFGISLSDQMILSVSTLRFEEEITPKTEQKRPNEGDLIYFPQDGKIFRIMYVNKREFFYPLGTLPTWELTVEIFEYSNETFNTGIEEIDSLSRKINTNILNHALKTDAGEYLLTDTGLYITQESFEFDDILKVADNKIIQEGEENYPIGSDDLILFDESNPFAQGNKY